MQDKQIINAFGVVLREFRLKNGLSQESLAHLIESHPTHISRLENGHKQPTLLTIFKIAEQLNVEPDQLITSMKIMLK